MRKERERERRRRAGSKKRDAKHRSGGDWTTLRIPDGMDVFQPKEGSVRMDIVPFVAGDGNPYADPGELYYERTFFVHRGVGPNNETYVCPLKTAKKPCYVCEVRAKLAADPDANEVEVKSLKPKERQVFLVHLVGKEDGSKVKLFESSFHTFGKLLDKLRQEAEADEPQKTDFDDPDAGATLKVSFAEEDAGGYTFLDCYSIEFKPRPNGIDQDLLDHGVCLDDLIKIPSYDEMRVAYEGGESDSEPSGVDDDDAPNQDARKPSKAKPKKPVDDEEYGDEEQDDEVDDEEGEPVSTAGDFGIEEGSKVRHRKHGVCEVVRISKDGTSLILEDEEGEEHRAIGVDEVKLIKEEAAPKKPTKGKPAPAKAKKPADDDDQEEDDEEEDEEGEPDPPRKSKGTGSKQTTSRSKKPADDDDWD